jgi:hypothetical protein
MHKSEQRVNKSSYGLLCNLVCDGRKKVKTFHTTISPNLGFFIKFGRSITHIACNSFAVYLKKQPAIQIIFRMVRCLGNNEQERIWNETFAAYFKTVPRHLSGIVRLKCDDTRAETRFRLSAKRTSPFKSAGASVHSTTGSRSVRISGSNAGYTMFRGSAKGTGYPLHSPVSPSLPLPCVTVCYHISTGFYIRNYSISIVF